MYKTLIVVDAEQQAQLELETDGAVVSSISFDTYLQDYPKLNEPRTRLINLCDTQTYLSKGYYCSLLAEARKHRVLPSVKTVNQLRAQNVSLDGMNISRADLMALLNGESCLSWMLYFGEVDGCVSEQAKLSKAIFKQYAAPLLRVELLLEEGGDYCLRLHQCSLIDLTPVEQQLCWQMLQRFTQTVWRTSQRQPSYRWDMAILVNPEEAVPPSNKEAIKKFVKAATKHGIRAEVVTAESLTHLSQYDALFVRETTAIDHHTYRLVEKAEAKGLVVMDDSSSILRCCNKVYLHDAFSYKKVPSLKTECVMDVNDNTLEKVEASFGYPMILKTPEGSFSRGVFKVSNRDELYAKLQELFKETAIVLAQEAMFTEFDWRIGVLTGRAIYACQYFMARNHWQIYNHDAKRFSSGDFHTLPTFEVPKNVLEAALKAAATIGQGLYGVDVKEHNHKAYVIEVNDNPSIDHKVEDAYLGDELYMQIMSEFYRRLEARGR